MTKGAVHVDPYNIVAAAVTGRAVSKHNSNNSSILFSSGELYKAI